MKQFTAAIIKLIGLVTLLYAIYISLSLIPMVIQDIISSYEYPFISLFYYILPVLGLLFIFYFCVYKTDELLRVFKISTEEKELVDTEQSDEIPEHARFSERAIFKTGIFLIGIYVLILHAPNVLVQLIQWLVDELTQTGGSALDGLLNLISPYSSETLLYSAVYTVAGFLMASKRTYITEYFLKEDKNDQIL